MFAKGFFDCDVRLQELGEAGDPLVMLDKLVDWEQFRPTLETIRSKTPKSKGGRKPYDAVMMFKILNISICENYPCFWEFPEEPFSNSL